VIRPFPPDRRSRSAFRRLDRQEKHPLSVPHQETFP
jgi:hypothetical protein